MDLEKRMGRRPLVLAKGSPNSVCDWFGDALGVLESERALRISEKSVCKTTKVSTRESLVILGYVF